MRRKRLQHVADILCHMFCGWRLTWSYPRLAELGSGTLRIDVLAQSCAFNDQPISPLPIVRELHGWMLDECADNLIDAGLIRQAELVVELKVGLIPRRHRRTTTRFFTLAQRLWSPPQFVSCAFACRSRVVTDETTYSSAYDDYEEWPSGPRP